MKILIDRASADFETKPIKECKKIKYRNCIFWYIEVNTLKGIFDLVKKEGKIIIEEPFPDEKELGFEFSITIYDDYVE